MRRPRIQSKGISHVQIFNLNTHMFPSPPGAAAIAAARIIITETFSSSNIHLRKKWKLTRRSLYSIISFNSNVFTALFHFR